MGGDSGCDSTPIDLFVGGNVGASVGGGVGGFVTTVIGPAAVDRVVGRFVGTFGCTLVETVQMSLIISTRPNFPFPIPCILSPNVIV